MVESRKDCGNPFVSDLLCFSIDNQQRYMIILSHEK